MIIFESKVFQTSHKRSFSIVINLHELHYNHLISVSTENRLRSSKILMFVNFSLFVAKKILIFRERDYSNKWSHSCQNNYFLITFLHTIAFRVIIIRAYTITSWFVIFSRSSLYNHDFLYITSHRRLRACQVVSSNTSKVDTSCVDQDTQDTHAMSNVSWHCAHDAHCVNIVSNYSILSINSTLLWWRVQLISSCYILLFITINTVIQLIALVLDEYLSNTIARLRSTLFENK